MTTPDQPALPNPAPKGRAFRYIIFALIVLAIASAAGWRYRITRPEYRMARGQEAIRDGDTLTARAYASRLEAAGDVDLAHLLRGEALHASGSPGPALAEFDKIISDSIRQRATSLTGRCMLELGDFRGAYRVFRQAVDDRPDDVDAHRGLAAITYDLGQITESLEHLKRVSELDPKDSRPHRLVGLIYKDMAQDEWAEKAYREALRLGLPPADERAVRLEFAEMLIRMTRYGDAFSTIEGIEPGDSLEEPHPASVRAQALRLLNRPQEAAEVLDRALQKHSTAALLRVRGQLHQDRSELPEALRCFERAVEAAPYDHQSHFALGTAYAGAGRKDDSAKSFARVEELKKMLDRITELTREAMAKPWEARVRLQLAELCDEMGKPQLAQLWRKAAAACSGPNS